MTAMIAYTGTAPSRSSLSTGRAESAVSDAESSMIATTPERPAIANVTRQIPTSCGSTCAKSAAVPGTTNCSETRYAARPAFDLGPRKSGRACTETHQSPRRAKSTVETTPKNPLMSTAFQHLPHRVVWRIKTVIRCCAKSGHRAIAETAHLVVVHGGPGTAVGRGGRQCRPPRPDGPC